MEPNAIDVEVGALMVDRFSGPQGGDHRQRLVEDLPVAPGLGRLAERGVLLLGRNAEPDSQNRSTAAPSEGRPCQR